jgi:hypothetical protein
MGGMLKDLMKLILECGDLSPLWYHSLANPYLAAAEQKRRQVAALQN